MPTEPLAITNSVSRSLVTRLLHRCPRLLRTTQKRKLHLAVKKRSSMTVSRILMELKRSKNKDLKKTQARRTIAQQKDALERLLTT